MDNVLDYVRGAFQRLFFDISDGNFSDIALTDLGVVAMVIAIPLFTIATFIGTHQKS